jgi:hypothetical protein
LPNGNGVMEDEEFSEEVTSSKHASEVCTWPRGYHVFSKRGWWQRGIHMKLLCPCFMYLSFGDAIFFKYSENIKSLRIIRVPLNKNRMKRFDWVQKGILESTGEPRWASGSHGWSLRIQPYTYLTWSKRDKIDLTGFHWI